MKTLPKEDFQTLGDRMKFFEGLTSDQRLMPGVPVIARMDGRSFHNFTKGFDRPFDAYFTSLMVYTAHCLVEETNASVAYTQSDEITLAWHVQPPGEMWFGGRVHKMLSQLGAQATLHFYRRLTCRSGSTLLEKKPTFDARIWVVPNRETAADVFRWREMDATRNSISMAAQSVYSHKELMHKSSREQQEMLHAKGINWSKYPDHFKRGTFIQKKRVTRPFTAAELDVLPPKHAARKNPDLIVERVHIAALEMPPLSTVRNLPDVLFEGAEPLTRKKS